jgi:hypothetical protein
MKKHNKERKIRHLRLTSKNVKKVTNLVTNLFDEVYTKQTENIRTSRGMCMGIWEFTKL